MKDFFIHESSYLDDSAIIGSGSKIWHFTHIMKNSTIGKKCNIGQNVVISPNVILGNNVKVQNNVSIYTGGVCEDNVFLGPSMVFTNILNPRSEFPQRGSKYYIKTKVKKSASIGANATILCGVTIGKYALVGAGSVVTKDVPDHAKIIGNPGKLVGWVDKEGDKLDFRKNGVSFCGNFILRNDKVSCKKL